MSVLEELERDVSVDVLELVLELVSELGVVDELELVELGAVEEEVLELELDGVVELGVDMSVL